MTVRPNILTDEIASFLHKHGFVVIATIDEDGVPHTSCKGIVKIGPDDTVYLLDLYRARTFKNLKRNNKVSITAVDEHAFKGYCLKGEAAITEKDGLEPGIIEAWEKRMSARITKRIVKNLQSDKGNHRHVHEVHLPRPEYLIAVHVKRIVDLVPPRITTR